VCDEKFNRKVTAVNHELRVHNFQRSEADVHSCHHTQCGKKFSTRQFLKVHETFAHGDEKSIICEACGKGFKSKSSLAQHRMTHVPYDELPHVCDHALCGKRFGWPSHLREHKRRIHGVGAKNKKSAIEEEESDSD
jgi:uncharacterized Zn-finger protein